MPTYEYRCRTCDVSFEVQQSFAEDSLTVCPTADSAQSPAACTAPGEGVVRKIFSAPSITFKGDGFYKTDSRSTSPRSGNGAKEKKPADQPSKPDGGTKEASGGGKEPSTAGESRSSGQSNGDRAPAGATSS
jgi:putative FmdB family regulatory protein